MFEHVENVEIESLADKKAVILSASTKEHDLIESVRQSVNAFLQSRGCDTVEDLARLHESLQPNDVLACSAYVNNQLQTQFLQ